MNGEGLRGRKEREGLVRGDKREGLRRRGGGGAKEGLGGAKESLRKVKRGRD